MLTAALLSFALAPQVFVAPDGDDAGPGSLSRPFATPARALEQVIELRRAHPDRDVVVLLRGGTYRMAAPLVMRPEAGGSDAATVLWSSYPGERAALSGGRALERLRHEDGDELARFALIEGAPTPRSAFAGLARLPRAHYPNDDWLRVDQAGEDRRTSFTFAAGAAPEIPDPAGLEVLLLHDWSTSRIPVAEYDPAAGRLATTAPLGCAAPHYAIDNFEPHPRFRLEGHPALIDAPSEWAVDAGAGELLMRSPPAAPVEVPVLEQLLRIAGTVDAPVRNLRFEGIDFELCAFIPPAAGWAGAQASMHEPRDGSDRHSQRTFVPAAVELEFAAGCSFTDVSFRRLDGSAVWLGRGCRQVALRRCVIRDVGANGVNLGEDAERQVDGEPWWRALAAAPAEGAVPEAELARGLIVERCLIERCGQRFGGAVGLWIGFAADCVIRHNTIRELPYTGLSVGWVWAQDPSPCGGHVIERNHIHDVMQLLSDGGCVYTLGRQPGTVIRDNLLHGVPRHAGRAPSNGIFMDQGSAEILVERNHIHDVDHSPIRFHLAGANAIRGNWLEAPEGTTPFFYNRTDPEEQSFEGNQVLEELSAAMLRGTRGWFGHDGEVPALPPVIECP